jgi:hypothetical protein
MTVKEFKAEIAFLDSGEGGRTQPFQSGYSSLMRFEGAPDLFGFVMTVPAAVAPGQTTEILAEVWAGEHLPDMAPGCVVEVLEGPSRVVGRGTLLTAPRVTFADAD